MLVDPSIRIPESHDGGTCSRRDMKGPWRHREGYLPMAWRRRPQRFLKWVGLLSCVLLVAAFAVSGRWHIGYMVQRGPFVAQVALDEGFLRIYWWSDVPLGQVPTGWDVYDLQTWRFDSRLLPFLSDQIGSASLDNVGVPLYLLFLGLVGGTVLCWRADRPTPAVGICPRCGYDLTGNVSGRCPECGCAIRDSHSCTGT